MVTAAGLPSIDDLKSLLPAFCRRHDIVRVELFGSLATGEAHAGSDIDLMITLRPDVRPGLEFFNLPDELESLLGCRVDLLTRRSVESDRNPVRRRSILESAREIYAA